MKNYGLTEREMKYIPLSRAKREHADNKIWYFIAFLVIFCIIATFVNQWI